MQAYNGSESNQTGDLGLQTGPATSIENTLKRNDPRLIQISNRSDINATETEEASYPGFKLGDRVNSKSTHGRKLEEHEASSPILIAS